MPKPPVRMGQVMSPPLRWLTDKKWALGSCIWLWWRLAYSCVPFLLFSLFRTLLALFLISVVSCSRSSLVSGETEEVDLVRKEDTLLCELQKSTARQKLSQTPAGTMISVCFPESTTTVTGRWFGFFFFFFFFLKHFQTKGRHVVDHMLACTKPWVQSLTSKINY